MDKELEQIYEKEKREREDLENRVQAIIDSYISKNETEHNKIRETLENKYKMDRSYYNEGKYQNIRLVDYVDDKGLNFNLGNVVKYVSRAGKKSVKTYVEDLEKGNGIWSTS
ncbi:MAG: DUF3310 domain-containing protein [Selenomonadaceae bacterium]|nr:DUF3310 domain-containing protein [Selenomonadaceae bacterium]